MIRTLKKHEQIEILSSNYIGNLSYIYRNRPFIVPITYYFDEKNTIIIGYSAEGHKIMAMRKESAVSLCVTEIESVNNWKSVVAHGTFCELYGSEAKAKLHVFSLGVKDLIIKKEHRDLDFISEFSSKVHKDDFPVTFIIKLEDTTGRIRNR